ncbi:MAG TPA: DMT family transporter [Chitinophagaceae bacterium]|nr:DMT family transporter [Chitinophagaceae bacterium]
MTSQNKIWTGIGLAILATLIWSGNFIVAKSTAQKIPPVSLNFFRWLCASLIIAPFAFKKFVMEKKAIRSSFAYLLFTSIFGISLFNTFVYIAGHYSQAINLALIGTTSSPIMSILLARIFLKEIITPLRITGMVICITGILLLLSKGEIDTLLHFRFTAGDWWTLAAAFSFAVYNILARRKPVNISPVNFLFITFLLGTILLILPSLIELQMFQPVKWDLTLILVILYLGAGASVISFFCWNSAISHLGAARTSLFGNLIPVFSAIEAVLLLNEKINIIHVISGMLVITGLVLANLTLFRKS